MNGTMKVDTFLRWDYVNEQYKDDDGVLYTHGQVAVAVNNGWAKIVEPGPHHEAQS